MYLTSLSILYGLIAVVTAAGPYQLQSQSPYFVQQQGCISTTANEDGAPVVIHDCNTEDSSRHAWELSLYSRVDTGPLPITIFNGQKCLDVKDGVNADGTKLQIWTCVPGNANQQWISVRDQTFRWSGTNKCIDLTNSNITDGNQLQIWTCDSNNTNQKFFADGVGNGVMPPAQFLAGVAVRDPAMCMTAESNTDGALVSIAPCFNMKETFPNGNSTWTYLRAPLIGPIKTYGGTKCLDVRGGADTNGTALQIWSCVEGNANQQFVVNYLERHMIAWFARAGCVDLTNGAMTPGNHVQVWYCDNANNNQKWFAMQ